MAFFHSKYVRNRGGRRRRPMRRLIGETLEEIQSVARRFPEATAINWPPRSHDAYRSKSLPLLFVDADRQDILDDLESVEVPEEYITVLTMMIRERFYNEKCGGPTEDSEKFFKIEIRGKIIQLLRAGAWIDEPSSLSLKKLNNRIEKCDLGRRSDLKFSSNPVPLNAVQKYDQDAKRDDLPDEELWEAQYRNGSPEDRKRQYAALNGMPWRQAMLLEKYGEP